MSAVELRVVGGGSKNPLWRRIIADAFQLPLRCRPVAVLAQVMPLLKSCEHLRSAASSALGFQHHDAWHGDHPSVAGQTSVSRLLSHGAFANLRLLDARDAFKIAKARVRSTGARWALTEQVLMLPSQGKRHGAGLGAAGGGRAGNVHPGTALA